MTNHCMKLFLILGIIFCGMGLSTTEAQDDDLYVGVLEGHTKLVNTAIYSPDRRTIVTTSYDETARVWDAISGEELFQLQHDGAVHDAAYSPDGSRLVTASVSSSARVWDTVTGEMLLQLEHGVVKMATFNTDGSNILTASLDGTARVWDAVTGDELLQLEHEDWVGGAVFAPDGQTIVTASADGTARVWDATTGEELWRPQHGDIVFDASYSPDGQTIVTASADGTARVWDATTGEELWQLQHGGKVIVATYSPDGQQIATASHDRTVSVWDAATGEAVAEMRGHTKEVLNVIFSPDGEFVFTMSNDKTVRMWDVATGTELLQLNELAEDAQRIASGFYGEMFITTDTEGTVRVWDIDTIMSAAAEAIAALETESETPDEHAITEPEAESETSAATTSEIIPQAGDWSGVFTPSNAEGTIGLIYFSIDDSGQMQSHSEQCTTGPCVVLMLEDGFCGLPLPALSGSFADTGGDFEITGGFKEESMASGELVIRSCRSGTDMITFLVPLEGQWHAFPDKEEDEDIEEGEEIESGDVTAEDAETLLTAMFNSDIEEANRYLCESDQLDEEDAENFEPIYLRSLSCEPVDNEIECNAVAVVGTGLYKDNQEIVSDPYSLKIRLEIEAGKLCIVKTE